MYHEGDFLNKDCATCGAPLKRVRYACGKIENNRQAAKRRYCNEDCRTSGKLRYGESVGHPCKGCGKPIVRRKYPGGGHEPIERARRRKYCDMECRKKSNIDRFWERVDRGTPEQCWGWKGPQSQSGYGKLVESYRRGIYHSAHRFSYELHFGPIPPKLFVLHSCDNPICVNPAHLRVGTPKENSRDMMERHRGVMGENHHQAKLTEVQVLSIRDDVLSSERELGAKYGVSPATIHAVRTMKTWRHITPCT